MNSKSRILIIVFSNLQHDARVKRQISFLSNDYSLTVLCFDSDPIPGVNIIQLKRTPLTFTRKAISGLLLLIKMFRIAHSILHDYSYIKDDLKGDEFQLTIANDVETLPLAFQLSRNKKVFFDAHEYAPRHFEDKLWWRIFFKGLNNYLCKRFIPKVVAMSTVGEGLAREYAKNFDTNPIIITNATNYHELPASEASEMKIKLVYHGIANPSRKIELMIEMMRHLDGRFSLDLILMVSDYASASTRSYVDNLAKAIEGNDRIKILPPLRSHEVVSFINQYDIGIFLIPPINFNYANTLPNKLFEYIQARLAIAVGPTPEMANIVTKYEIGVVATEFSAASLAERLNALTAARIMEFKRNSSRAARDLCAENNKAILTSAIQEILNNP